MPGASAEDSAEAVAATGQDALAGALDQSTVRPVPTFAVPGTLCPTEVFAALPVTPVDWMGQPGPWDISSIAARVITAIEAGPLPSGVVVVGHSTGGLVALQVAITRPDLVAGLLLVDTGAHMQGHGDVDAILGSVRDDWGPGLHEKVLDRSFRQPLDPVVRARWLEWAGSMPREAALDALTSQRDLDLRPRLAEVTCPVTVVHGRFDQARPLTFAEELAGGLPDAELVVLETGHTPVWEAPQEVRAALRGLWARV